MKYIKNLLESHQNLSQKDDISERYQRFSMICNSLRAISILLIVLFHIGTWFLVIRSYFPIYIAMIFDFGNIGLDFFIFLSGMLLVVNILQRGIENHKWSDWYKKRVLRIYPAYWLMLIIIMIFYLLFFGTVFNFHVILINLSGFQTNLIYNPNFSSIHFIFWFLTIILSCYLLFPIIFYGIRKNFKITTIITIALYLLYIFYSDIYSKPALFLEKSLNFELYNGTYMHFIFRFFEFFLGALFGYWIGKDNMKNLDILFINKIGLVFFIFVTSIFAFFIFSYLSGDYYRWIFPYITFLTIPFLFYVFNRFFKSNNYLEFFGKRSYEIFLCHSFIALFLFAIFLTKLLLPNNLILNLIILSLFIVLIFYFAYLLNKMVNIMLKKQKWNPFFVLFALSLIIFTFISFFIFFPMELYLSIPIYSSIVLILFYFYKKKGLGKNILKEPKNKK